VDWQKDQLGRQTSFDYTTIPSATKITDPKSNVTIDTYTDGLLTQEVRGSGSAQAVTATYSYDPVMFGVTSTTITAVGDPNNHQTTAQYDAQGNVTRTTDGLNRETTYTYGPHNELTSKTEPRPSTLTPTTVTTTWEYNAKVNLIRISRALYETGQTQLIQYFYDDLAHPGDQTRMIDGDGKTWNYAYNLTTGDRTSVTAPPTPENSAGNKTTYGYDSVGRLTSMVNPKGNLAGADPLLFRTTYAYNENDQQTTVTDPLGHQTVRHYDANGNLDQYTDGDNRVTQYRYDLANQQVKVIRADTTEVRSDYWPDGTLNHQYDGANQPTTYTSDALGRVASVADSLSRTTAYTYGATGKALTVTDPSNRVATSTYDNADELTSVNYSGSTTPDVSSIHYWPNGQRKDMTDGTGTSTYSYDSLGRLTSTTNGALKTLGYTYDLRDHVKTITYPGGTNTATRNYDDAGRLASVQDWLGHTITFGRDSNSNVAAETFPTGTSGLDTYGYDNADQVSGITAAKAGSNFATFNYTRDGNNQLTSTTPTGVPGVAELYPYTALNQLKNVNSATYTYDAADNPTTLATTTTQTFDATNQVRASNRSGANNMYGFDPQGNRTTSIPPAGNGAAYTYDQANRITAFNPTYPSQIAGGWFHSVAIGQLGSVFAWGLNSNGELGDNTTTNRSSPVLVGGLAPVQAVAAGISHSVALKYDGTVWAWGSNGNGQLGDATITERHTPVPAAFVGGMVAIAAGGAHTLALKSDGTVWAWGANNHGQLGTNSTTEYHSLVQVSGLTNVVTIAAGQNHSVALKSDGSVWAWGANDHGQLGDATTIERHTPVAAVFTGGMTAIAAGSSHTLALKNDGTVWDWGLNANGQLGNDSTTEVHALVQVSGLTNVSAIAGGWVHSVALKRDATVWDWGANTSGQLGNGNNSDSHLPVQAGFVGGIGAVATGGFHTLALRIDGQAWSWGANAYGALGNGTTTDSNSVVFSQFNRGPFAKAATYGYNGDGLRMSKTVAGTTTQSVWDSTQGLPLLLKDGSTNYLYGPNGVPIEQITTSGTVTYYHQDQLGSTRVLTDSAGNVSATFSYDAYGKASGFTGSVTTPFGYTGQYADAESGLVYLRSRYYDPGSAQFLSRDAASSLTLEPYQYVSNNPLNDLDPNGLLCVSPKCLVGYVRKASFAIQLGADIVGTASAASGFEPAAGVAFYIAGIAGFANASATCASVIVGEGATGADCAANAAITFATMGIARSIGPSGWSGRTRTPVFTEADRIIQGGVDIFGDLLGWARGYKIGDSGTCPKGSLAWKAG
jgi:RHS repeat-associated protein